MIISSERHDLLDAFKQAEEVEVAATMELNAYISAPNAGKDVAM